MPSPYLSKSDFKACCDCRTKLFYRKHSYPTNLDENEYLKFLADGGFMIETVAKAQYPTGVDLVDERDPLRAFARTTELINASPDAVVFEAAAIWGKFYARIDVLRREGNTLHLIEVKSSSINAEDPEDDAESPFLNTKGAVSSKWREYLLDVAFQARLLRKAFPTFRVKPWLCVVNKGHRATAYETMAAPRSKSCSPPCGARPPPCAPTRGSPPTCTSTRKGARSIPTNHYRRSRSATPRAMRTPSPTAPARSASTKT